MTRWVAVAGLLLACNAHALTVDEALGMAVGESDARIEALAKAVAQGDDKTASYLQALADDAVKVAAGKVLVVKEGKGMDPVSGEAVDVPADAEDVMLNNRLRGEIDTALAALKLFSTDVALRQQAALALLKEPDASRQAVLEKALAAEKDAAVLVLVKQALAAVQLASESTDARLHAARTLAESSQPEVLLLLNQQLSNESDVAVQSALKLAISKVQDNLRWGERLGQLFTGASLGSILLLVALGLAITYGLMGVINMAHGELMMIGAYATYAVQVAFRNYLPDAFDYYLLAALPVAFATSALVGALMERSILKHLYGRPLETLLATWGISLILMQAVRSLFGAQNVGVENPSWMSGSVQLMSNLQLPWNRVLIIGFAAAVLLGMSLLIAKTRLGLFVRGVTQNRPMASCMGINTARIDTYAFALGSGIAGLAGCALSQIGNVGPDLGQGYIVDSFMVVVLGGVGQLAGTVYAVLAKIAVLVFIIVFIQKRPQGIFAMKGRSAEA
jgi:urea transport system permease protein